MFEKDIMDLNILSYLIYDYKLIIHFYKSKTGVREKEFLVG